MEKKSPIMVIPTYWRREEWIGIKDTDITYDHPTPLNQEGTLKRAIESANILKDKDFVLVILGVSNAEDIEDKVERKVFNIISNAKTDFPIYFFSHSHLKTLKNFLKDHINEDLLNFLSLKGYSNVRNMCLFLTHLFGSEIAILIDDDEVFEDPYFIRKAMEFIGENVNSDFIGAVAGYYIQPDGGWRLKPKKEKWAKYWNTVDKMNEAFEIFIGKPPRLKVTPFAFGGNMVIHKEIFSKIPFDPNITRGEDIDFLINMRMFNFKCYLDNTLSIKHLPPPKPHPIWKQMREDIYRFLYEREKIRKQRKIEGMHYVKVEEFDPYPGAFLRDNLEEKIYKANHLLAEYYREKGLERDAEEALRNIKIVKEYEWLKKDPFSHYLKIQDGWKRLMEHLEEIDLKEKAKDTIQQVK